MTVAGIIVVIVVFAFVLLKMSGKFGIAQQDLIRVADIAKVYAQLKATGSNGSFAVFLPADKAASDKSTMGIQFSIEDNAIGLDWYLYEDTPESDAETIRNLARKEGVRIDDKHAGGFHYLRTTDRRAPELCALSLHAIYGLGEFDTVEMIVEAFEWPPGSKA